VGADFSRVPTRHVTVSFLVRRISALYRGFASPEGPVGLKGSRWLVTEMDTGAVSRIGPAGERIVIASTGRPNGLAIDGNETLWIAESREPSLMHISAEADIPVVVTTMASGEPLLWPNDLCVGPDGTIYLTDSGARIGDFESDPRPLHTRDLDGRVISVDPTTGEARILDRGLEFANGIAIGPDNESLFVAETLTGLIHVYPLSNVRSSTRATYGNVLERAPSDYPKIAGPDGMAFDEEGRLLVAVLTQGTLTVLGPDGRVEEHIALPDSFPTNLAFGGPNRSTVLVTGCETGVLYGLDWDIGGLELHYPLIDHGA